MISFSSALQEQLKGRIQDVRMAIEISGYTNPSGKAIVYTTAAATVPNQDVRPLLSAPDGVGSRVDLNDMKNTLSAIGFAIIDKDNEITSRLDDFVFKGKDVTLKLGIGGVAFADWATVYQGIITDFDLSGNGLSWEFTTSDKLFLMDKDIFIVGITKLSNDLDTVSITIPVESTSDFSVAGPFVNHEIQATARGHFIIGSGETAEIIEWTAKDATNFTTVSRGQQGTTVQSFKAGTTVTEFIIWPGHPLEILSVIMGGVILEEGAAYANVPASWKMTPALILDTASWIAAKDRTRWAMYDYRTTDKLFVRTFAENEILIPLRLFFRQTTAGTVAIVPLIERPIPLTTYRQIKQDQMKSEISFDSRSNEITNRVVAFFDWDIVTKQFRTQNIVNDSASQTKYGVLRTWSPSIKGLRSEFGGVDQAEIMARDHFLIFGDAKPEVGIAAFPSQADLEPGDAVKVTHARLPAMSEGARGVADRFLKIMEVRTPFNALSPNLTFLDADIPSTNKYGSIAEDGTPDFPSATATQQVQRLFIDRSFRGA